MCTGLEIIALAGLAAGTATSLYATDTAAKQEEANAKFAAEQAEADAKAEAGAAQVEADRIRKAAKRQKSAAIAAAAASGVDVDSASAVKIDEEINKNAEEDAYLTLVGGSDRAARLNQQATADRYAGDAARTAGKINQASTLLSAAGTAANAGRGWKRAPKKAGG